MCVCGLWSKTGCTLIETIIEVWKTRPIVKYRGLLSLIGKWDSWQGERGALWRVLPRMGALDNKRRKEIKIPCWFILSTRVWLNQEMMGDQYLTCGRAKRKSTGFTRKGGKKARKNNNHNNNTHTRRRKKKRNWCHYYDRCPQLIFWMTG